MPVRRTTRLDKLVEAWEPQLRKAFMESVYNMRDAAQLDLIIRFLSENDIESALRAVGIDPLQWIPWDKAVSATFEAGGVATAGAVPEIISSGGFRTIFTFNVRNPAAERWLADRAGRAISDIVSDQLTMIRNYLRVGMERGNNPRTVALDLVGRINPATGRRENGVIGLTDSQMQWVRNYEEELRSENPLAALERQLRDKRFDGIVKRAAAKGEAISDSDINSMVDAYTNRALRYRAETIARTEAMAALHEGQQQALAQAISAGIDASAVGGIWRTAEDDRVRESHVSMDGQRQPYGQPFISGSGNLLWYPGDPSAPPEETIQCRCWLEPDIDFLAGVE